MTNTAARNQVFAALESQRHGAEQTRRNAKWSAFRQATELLSAQYAAALLAGDPRADSYRARGLAIINGFHGTEVN